MSYKQMIKVIQDKCEHRPPLREEWDGMLDICETCLFILPSAIVYLCEFCLSTYCADCVQPNSWYKVGSKKHTFCSQLCKNLHQTEFHSNLIECGVCKKMVEADEIYSSEIDMEICQICYSFCLVCVGETPSQEFSA